jgi:hypothetical protein
MQLNVGWIYKFKFNVDFSSLDGIYTVLKIYTYDELLEDGLNLFDGLYTHVNKTESQLDTDSEYYRTQSIFKLVSPTDSSIVYYVPEGICSFVPDHNVKRYPVLALAFKFGACKDAEELTHIKSNVSELISKMFGITDAPLTMTVNDVYLTDEEYSQVVQDRRQNGIDIVNYFGENVELRKENARLAGIIAAYQAKLMSLTSNP